MFLAISLVVLAVTLFVFWKIWKPHQLFKELGVAHLKPWPIIGNFPKSTMRTQSFPYEMQNLCNEFKNKRYFGLYQFLTPIVMIQDLELIKKVTVKDFEHFVDHQRFVSTTDPLWEKNMFALNGDKWRDMRATLSPAFTGSKMRTMFHLVLDCSEKCAQHFLSKKQKVVPLEMKEMFTKFTTDVIATTAFGLENDSFGEEKNEFFTMGQDATDLSGWRAVAFFIYQISPAIANLLRLKMFSKTVGTFFRKVVKDAMTYREKNNVVRPDLLQLLIDAQKGKLKTEKNTKNDESGFAAEEEMLVDQENQENIGNKLVLTDDDITAQALLFFFGGFDTVSTLMCHMAYELALNPDVHAKLQKEVDDTLEACNGKLTFDALMHMKYMDMVVSESLRKWPPAPVTDRICTKPYTIEPENEDETRFTIEKGSVIWVAPYYIHRNPEYYPDPEKFDPERFSDENKGSIQPFTYIPFGMGPRICIGSRFALMENKAVFFSLLTHFNIVPVEKTTNPLVLSSKYSNMMAEGGFWVGLEARKKSE